MYSFPRHLKTPDGSPRSKVRAGRSTQGRQKHEIGCQNPGGQGVESEVLEAQDDESRLLTLASGRGAQRR